MTHLDHDPAASDLDFILDGQDLVITYGVQLSDGTNTGNTGNIQITISGENDAPSISDATYTLNEDTESETIFHAHVMTQLAITDIELNLLTTQLLLEIQMASFPLMPSPVKSQSQQTSHWTTTQLHNTS